MKSVVLFAGLALVGSFTSPAGEQGRGAFGSVARAAEQVGEVTMESVPSDPSWQAVMEDGKQIGAYRPSTGEYAALDPSSGRWRRSSDRAWHAEDAKAAIRLSLNSGLDWRRLQQETPGYRIGARFVTEKDALTALKPSPKLVDDSMLPSLTLIGSEGECRAVEQELERHPTLAKLRRSFLLQSYRRGDPMVAQYGFVTGGRPSIYFSRPDGKVLFRADHNPGAEMLAEAVSAGIDDCCPAPRRPKPDYEPARDPEPIQIIRREVSAWHWALAIVGAIMGVVIMLAVMACVIGFAYFGLSRVFRRPPPPPPAASAATVVAVP